MTGEMNHDSWGEPFVRYIMTDRVNHIWCTPRKISKDAQKSKIV